MCSAVSRDVDGAANISARSWRRAASLTRVSLADEPALSIAAGVGAMVLALQERAGTVVYAQKGEKGKESSSGEIAQRHPLVPLQDVGKVLRPCHDPKSTV